MYLSILQHEFLETLVFRKHVVGLCEFKGSVRVPRFF